MSGPNEKKIGRKERKGTQKGSIVGAGFKPALFAVRIAEHSRERRSDEFDGYR